MLKRLVMLAMMIGAFGIFGLAAVEPVQAQAFYGTNWQAQFYNNSNHTPPVAFTAVDNDGISEPYGAGAPSQGGFSLPADNFSVRWSGQQFFANTGTYQFVTRFEDDVRVTVGPTTIIAYQGTDISGIQTKTGSLQLATGTYEVVVEFVAFTGNAHIEFFWQFAGAGGGGQQPVFTPTFTLTASRTPLPAIPPGALTATVIRASILNVRDAPTTGGRRLGRIRRGETYAVLGRDADARWFLLQLGGYQGWAYGYYLFVNGNEFNPPITSPFGTLGVPGGWPDTGAVAQSTATLVLRDIPSVAGTQIGRVTWGGFLPIVGKTGDGFWYQVAWKGTIGWVYSPFTKLVEGDINNVPVR